MQQYYVNDILITSDTWEEHCSRIEVVLNKLQNNNITLKLDKSKFITNELQFLGFILSETGITITRKGGSNPEFPQTKKLKTAAIFFKYMQLLPKVSAEPVSYTHLDVYKRQIYQ